MTFIEGRYTLLPWCRRYDNMGKSEIVSNIPKNDESYLIKDLKNKWSFLLAHTQHIQIALK